MGRAGLSAPDAPPRAHSRAEGDRRLPGHPCADQRGRSEESAPGAPTTERTQLASRWLAKAGRSPSLNHPNVVAIPTSADSTDASGSRWSVVGSTLGPGRLTGTPSPPRPLVASVLAPHRAASRGIITRHQPVDGAVRLRHRAPNHSRGGVMGRRSRTIMIPAASRGSATMLAVVIISSRRAPPPIKSRVKTSALVDDTIIRALAKIKHRFPTISRHRGRAFDPSRRRTTTRARHAHLNP